MRTSLSQSATSPKTSPAAQLPRELSGEQLHFRLTFPETFRTTAELMAASPFVGQERARAALDLGVGISSRGFNIFVSGLTGAEKLDAVRRWIAQHAAQAPAPCDWVLRP